MAYTLYTQKSQSFRPRFLPKFLYYMLGVLRGRRHTILLSLWQYRRIFDSSWQYKQGSLSRRPYIQAYTLYTQNQSFRPRFLPKVLYYMLSVLRGRRHAILQFIGNIERYLIVRGNISGESFQRPYIQAYTLYTPKSVVSAPLLAESSILYAGRIAWPPPRDSTSLWQYRRIFDSSWQYKQGSLSRGHIYRPIHYTPKISRFDPASCRKFYIIC